MNLKSTSSKQPLSTGSPLTTLPENKKAPMVQSTGQTVKLQTEPSQVKYGSGTSSGEFQTSSSLEIKLNKTPRTGYEGTSPSERASAPKGY